MSSRPSSKFSEKFKFSRDVTLSHKVFPYTSDLEGDLDAPLGLFVNPFESKLNSLRKIDKAIRCQHCSAYLSSIMTQSLLNHNHEWLCELCFKLNKIDSDPLPAKSFESSMTVNEYILPMTPASSSDEPDSNERFLPLSAESYPIVHILVIKEGCDYDLYRLFSEAMKSVAPFIHQDIHLGILTYNETQISLYNISQTPSKVSIPFVTSASGLKEVSIPLIEVMSPSQFLVSHSIKAFLATLDSILDDELQNSTESSSPETVDNSSSFVLTSVFSAIKDWFLGKGSVELMETGTSFVSSANNPDYFSNTNSMQSNIYGDMTKTNTDSYDLSKIWTVLKSMMNNTVEEEENNIVNSESQREIPYTNSTAPASSFSSIQLHVISDVVEPLFAEFSEEMYDQSSLYKGGSTSGLYSLKQSYISLNLIPHLFILHDNNKIPLLYSVPSSSPSLFPHSLSSFINTLGGNIWSNNIMDDYQKNLGYLTELFIQLFDYRKLFSKCCLMMRTSDNINLQNAGILNNKILPYNPSSSSNFKPVPVSWLAPGLSHEQHESIWRVPRLTSGSSLGLEVHISNLNNSSTKSEKFIELSDSHITNYLLNIKDSIVKVCRGSNKSSSDSLKTVSDSADPKLDEAILKELSSYLPPKLALNKLTQTQLDKLTFYLGDSMTLPLLYATFQITVAYEQVIDIIDEFEENYYDLDEYSDSDEEEELKKFNCRDENELASLKVKLRKKLIEKNHDRLKKKRQLDLLKSSVDTFEDYLPFLSDNSPRNLEQKLSDFIEMESSDNSSPLYNINTVDSLSPKATGSSTVDSLPKYNYYFHPSSRLYTLKKLRVITFRVPLSNNLSTIIASSSASTISQLIIRKSLQLSHGILGLPIVASDPDENSASASNSHISNNNHHVDFDLPQFSDSEAKPATFSFSNFSRINALSKFFSKSFQIPSLSRLYKSTTSSHPTLMSKGDFLLLISQSGSQGEVVIIEALLNILMKRFDYAFDEYQRNLAEKKKSDQNDEENKVASSHPTTPVKTIPRSNSGLLDGVYYVDIEAPRLIDDHPELPSTLQSLPEPELNRKETERQKRIEEKKREKDERIAEKLKIITNIFGLKSVKHIIGYCFNYLVKLSHSYPATATATPLYSSRLTSSSELILNNYPSSTIYNILGMFNSLSVCSLSFFARLVTPSFFFLHYKSGYLSTNYIHFSSVKSSLNYLVQDSILVCDCGKEVIVYIPSDILWESKKIEVTAPITNDEEDIESEKVEENQDSTEVNPPVQINLNNQPDAPIKTFLKSSLNTLPEEIPQDLTDENQNSLLNDKVNIISTFDGLESDINLYYEPENSNCPKNKDLDDLRQSLEKFKYSTSVRTKNDLMSLLDFFNRIIGCAQENYDVIPFKLSEYSSATSSLFTQYSSPKSTIMMSSYLNRKDLEAENKIRKETMKSNHGIGRLSSYEENGEGINQDLNFNDLSLTDFSEALAEIIMALMDD